MSIEKTPRGRRRATTARPATEPTTAGRTVKRGTAPVTTAPEPAADDALASALAHLHLRLGMLPIALASLEELAARDALDLAGRADLAEARWRSGDLAGAAAAAAVHLEEGGRAPIALVVAAEAAAANGRPTEARTHVDRLAALDAAALDALFAGMPRRASWPFAPTDVVEAATLFEAERARPGRTVPPAASGAAAPSPGGSRPVPAAPGLWDRLETAAVRPDTSAPLDDARRLVGHDDEAAALRFALVLRTDPKLAAAVLDALPAHGSPSIEVVRGDAHRLLGRHRDADAAYAAAAAALHPPSTEES